MPTKNIIQKSNLIKLESAITKKYPFISSKQAKSARENIIEYITQGLEDGYDIALIKPVNDEEISIKVLKLGEKKYGKAQKDK